MGQPSINRVHHMCRHCTAHVPAESPVCPGCGRPAIDGWRSVASTQRRVSRQTIHLSPPLADEGYRSLLRPAAAARALLTMSMVVGVVTAATYAWWVIQLDQPVVTGNADRAGIESVARAATLMLLASVAVTGVGFTTWAVRAYRNLPALGIRERRYWTIWLIVGWIVPGANLFVPKLLVDDIWRASSPAVPLDGSDAWQRRPVATLVNRWWYSFLLTPAIGALGVIVARGGIEDFDQRILVGAIAAVAAGSIASTTSAARTLVAVVTVAQARRADMVADVRSGEVAAGEHLAALDRAFG